MRKRDNLLRATILLLAPLGALTLGTGALGQTCMTQSLLMDYDPGPAPADGWTISSRLESKPQVRQAGRKKVQQQQKRQQTQMIARQPRAEQVRKLVSRSESAQ